MAFTLGVGPTDGWAAGSTAVSTLTSTTIGRSIVAMVRWSGNSETISSITCTGESNLTVHGSPLYDAATGVSMQFASLGNNTAGGTKTITVTMSGAITKGITTVEVAGGNTTSLFNVASSTAGNSTNPTSSITTTSDNCFIFSQLETNLGTSTAGSGYTGYTPTPVFVNAELGEYDLDAGAAGVTSVPYANATSQAWFVASAAFNVYVLPPGPTEVVIVAPAPTLLAGDNGAALTAPAPTLFADPDSAVLTAPAPTLESTVVGAATSALDAPAPTLDAVLELGGALAVNATAPAPTLSATGFAGIVITFAETAPVPTLESSADMILLEAPAPTLEAMLLAGGYLSIALVTPAPLLVATLVNSAIITAANTATTPALSAAIATGNIATAALLAQAPVLSASGLAGNLLTAELEAIAPTLAAAGYGAYTITFDNAAPTPHMDAMLYPALTAAYRVWALNLKRGALTAYDNFDYNSFCHFNGQVLAAGAGGVFVLGTQALDNATAITGRYRTGISDFGSSFHKRVPRLFIDGSQSGDMKFRTVTTESGERTYVLQWNKLTGQTQRRVPVGKGPRSRFWQFEGENVDGADFSTASVMAYPTILRRRVS